MSDFKDPNNWMWFVASILSKNEKLAKQTSTIDGAISFTNKFLVSKGIDFKEGLGFVCGYMAIDYDLYRDMI